MRSGRTTYIVTTNSISFQPGPHQTRCYMVAYFVERKLAPFADKGESRLISALRETNIMH